MNFGRYEIIKEVGRGSMGVVYQARDPHIDRMIAVKVMRQDRMANETFVKRFMKEARVIGRLSHPRIVTIYDVGEERDEIYIAMEFLEGTSLADVIKERRLEPEEIAEFGRQIAETLDYAHRKGVVHRDIKPSNIIVEPDGQTKITDFGIARIEDPSATLQTQTGEIMGTPAYMSPEQVLGNQVDGRSDIFSLGVILYELSMGRRPFGGDGKTLATVFNDIIGVTPQDPDSISSIPHSLSGIIMKALQKDPAQRFQTGKEMADALDGCLAKPAPAADSTSTVTAPEKKKNYIVPIVIAFVLTAVIGGAAVFYLYRVRQVPTSNQASRTKNPPLKVVQPPPPVSNQADRKPLTPAEPATTGEETVKPVTVEPAMPVHQETKPPEKTHTDVQPHQPRKPELQPRPATLTIRTNPAGAVIHINGKLKGISPLTLTLPKGRYRVRATLPGYERNEQSIVLKEATKYPLSLNLKTAANSNEWVIKPLVDKPNE